MRFVLCAAFGTLVFASSAAGAAPLEAYGQLQSLDLVTLSPDGTKIAYIVEIASQHTRLVVVQPTEGGAAIGGVKIGDAKVRALQWADNTRLITTVSQTARARDVIGPRQEFYEAMVLDLATNKQFNLMSGTSSGQSLNTVADLPQIRMVDGKPIAFTQGIYFPENHGRLALFAVNLDGNHSAKLIDGHSANANDWLVDAQGNVVTEEDYGDRAGHWSLRLHRDGQWKEIYGEDIVADTPDVYGFSNNGNSIIVRTMDKSGAVVVKGFSVADASPVKPAEHEGRGNAVLDRLTGRIVATRYVGHDIEYDFIDPKDEAAWQKVLAYFPGEQVDLTSMNDDRTKFAVQVTGTKHGFGYFIVDIPSGQLAMLGPAYAAIEAHDMSRVVPFLYPTADGRQIDAYLTLPTDRDPKNLPLIVLPHGGPASRDEPGFDWWSQALASLGYAVLQPQFRGSDGFGWDLLSAGFGQWGRKMQTDLSDGTRALVKAGIADPSRVCIVGASYGGYAAMAGATLDTGVYRCAVSVGGISDMREFISWRENRTSAENLEDRYWMRFAGAATTKDPVLDAISPIHHIDKVTIPILLIHGRDDTVVPIAQSRDMADALKQAGKNVTFVPLEGEDHWLSRSATRQAMLKATADFLQTNNPP